MTHTRPLEKLLHVAKGRDCLTIVADHKVAWARAGDLIVGFVIVAPETAVEQLDEAYEALDNSRALSHEEMWSIVLVVEVLGDDQVARACARHLERDLSRSRKLARTATEALPLLFDNFETPGKSLAALDSDVVRQTLEQIATGELRVALEVLLRERRNSADVERLIEILGQDPAK